MLLIQKLARVINAIFPDITEEVFDESLEFQVMRTLVNMSIDDETVELGAHELGITTHDFLSYSKDELQELARANLNKSITKDLWPYEDLMTASKLLSFSDDDVDKTT